MSGFFDLVRLILRLWDVIQSIIARFKAQDAENWDKKIEAGVRAYLDLQNSKTPEERKDAQKRISDSWLSL